MTSFSPSVVVAEQALDMMQAAGSAALPLETGGILAGFRAGDEVVVTRAAVVPDSASSRSEYCLRRDRAMRELARLQAGSARVVGYVGDWHTHPVNVPPSGIDIASLELVASAAKDLVALIVVPFDAVGPRPPYARVGRRVTGGRRSGATSYVATITTSSTDPEDLERSADTALNWKESPTP